MSIIPAVTLLLILAGALASYVASRSRPSFTVPAAIGAAAGGLLGFLGKKDKETVQEQTKQITSQIKITNRKLDYVNRNLSALADKMEPYPLPESYYFSSDAARGWMR